MPVLSGSCHCGTVRVSVQITGDPASLPLRACQCSFCRMHGAKTFADPGSSVRLDSGRSLTRYRFGKRTADFLLCPHCGAYVAAVIEHEGGHLATINAIALQIQPIASQEATAVSYDDEAVQARRKRREQRWMPIILNENNPAVE